MQKKVFARCLLALPLVLALAQPAQARNDNRVLKGAVVGGVLGLAAGNGLKDALGGAMVGGGVAAISKDGYKGRKARSAAKKGAVVGAVIGGIAGDGLRGALKGAVAGGAAGAIISQ